MEKAPVSTDNKKVLQHFNFCKDLPDELYEASFTQNNAFWTPEYFRMIGETCDKNFEQHWLLQYDEAGILKAAATFQVFTFLGKNYSYDFRYDGLGSLIPELSKWFLKQVIRPFKLKLLVQGNAFTTGNFSMVFDRSKTDAAEWAKAVYKWQKEVFLQSRNDIDTLLWKDFAVEELSAVEHLKADGFLQFKVQPTMRLDIPGSWNSFKDYLSDMQSKYRSRMKKVFKDGKAVESHWMNKTEIQQNSSQLQLLYEQVVEPSNFKMTTLPVDHLWKLLRKDDRLFKVLGFYAPEGLIGFISFYHKNGEMHAGFMGIERKYQRKYDQYLRTLLELIKAGIDLRFERLFFGRTAMEIKSSTGSEPQDLYLFGKHRNPLINGILQPLVQRLSVQPEWTQRHPFKEK